MHGELFNSSKDLKGLWATTLLWLWFAGCRWSLLRLSCWSWTFERWHTSQIIFIVVIIFIRNRTMVLIESIIIIITFIFIMFFLPILGFAAALLLGLAFDRGFPGPSEESSETRPGRVWLDAAKLFTPVRREWKTKGKTLNFQARQDFKFNMLQSAFGYCAHRWIIPLRLRRFRRQGVGSSRWGWCHSGFGTRKNPMEVESLRNLKWDGSFHFQPKSTRFTVTVFNSAWMCFIVLLLSSCLCDKKQAA